MALHRPWLPAQVATFHEHTDRVNDITFSSNGDLMISVGRDAWIRLWRTEPPARPGVEQLSFCPLAFARVRVSTRTSGGTKSALNTTYGLFYHAVPWA